MTATIDAVALRRVARGLSKDRSEMIARGLGQGFAKYGITTPKRAAAAVAQMAHESAGFATFEEYASGAAYEGRSDLGNTQSGDGRRFKGRGLIMVTGRTNYRSCSSAMNQDFVGNPGRMGTMPWAAMASCWWWKSHGCNALADSGDFVALTRRINGGTNGLADRQRYHARAKQVASRLVPKSDALAGYTEAEVRWIREYDKLVREDRDKARRRVLRRTMCKQRKRIYRAAEGTPNGWKHANRRKRYDSMKARSDKECE